MSACSSESSACAIALKVIVHLASLAEHPLNASEPRTRLVGKLSYWRAIRAILVLGISSRRPVIKASSGVL